MLTGQSDRSTSITDQDILGFSLAFGGLLRMWRSVAQVGDFQLKKKRKGQFS